MKLFIANSLGTGSLRMKQPSLKPGWNIGADCSSTSFWIAQLSVLGAHGPCQECHTNLSWMLCTSQGQMRQCWALTFFSFGSSSSTRGSLTSQNWDLQFSPSCFLFALIRFHPQVYWGGVHCCSGCTSPFHVMSFMNYRLVELGALH